MAYNYEYPYTDPNRYNDDWLLNKMKELDSRLDGLVRIFVIVRHDVSSFP